MSGPLVGGMIADSLGWEWAFWINVPTSAFSLLGGFVLYPKKTPRSPLGHLPTLEKVMQLDLIGSSLLIASICCLIVLLQNYAASITTALSQTDIVLSAASCLFFILFILQEIFIRPDLALIPRAILRRRAVWANCLVLFLLFMGFTNFVFFFSIFLQVCVPLPSTASTAHLTILGTPIGRARQFPRTKRNQPPPIRRLRLHRLRHRRLRRAQGSILQPVLPNGKRPPRARARVHVPD